MSGLFLCVVGLWRLGIVVVLLDPCVVRSCRLAWFELLFSFHCEAKLGGLYCTVTLYPALVRVYTLRCSSLFLRIALPRCWHCFSVPFSIHHCQDALITYTLQFHAFPGGFCSLPVCYVSRAESLPGGLFCLHAVLSILHVQPACPFSFSYMC